MADDDNQTSATREEGEVQAEGDFSKKHPLEHKWVLWYDNQNQQKGAAGWGQTLRAVYSFDTVEDFWCLYNNIKPPSWLPTRTDFHLFKEGVEPKWEDPRNEHGGKWTINVPKGGANKSSLLDTFWLSALLACIGEQLTEGDDVCGIVANIRGKQDRLSVWTKSAANEAVQTSIGRQLKQFLDLGDSQKIGYMAHQDAMQNERNAKDRYHV